MILDDGRAMHNYLISDSTLETVAKHIGLGDIMLCSVGLTISRIIFYQVTSIIISFSYYLIFMYLHFLFSIISK